MSTWLRIDLPVDRLPDLVVRAEPARGGAGWHVRDERTRGGAATVILGVLNAAEPVYDVHVG